MSQDKLVELVHSYAHFLHMRTALEQMAEDEDRATPILQLAVRLVANEREARRGSRCRGG